MNDSHEHTSTPVILIIDDNAQYRSMLSEMLDVDGYHVLTAENGNLALKSLEEARVDLVITDILMPEKGGVETIIELRQKFPNLPVIAMSGGGRTGNMDFLEIARNVGVQATLTKPIELDTLLDTVSQALSQSGG